METDVSLFPCLVWRDVLLLLLEHREPVSEVEEDEQVNKELLKTF